MSEYNQNPGLHDANTCEYSKPSIFCLDEELPKTPVLSPQPSGETPPPFDLGDPVVVKVAVCTRCPQVYADLEMLDDGSTCNACKSPVTLWVPFTQLDLSEHVERTTLPLNYWHWAVPPGGDNGQGCNGGDCAGPDQGLGA